MNIDLKNNKKNKYLLYAVCIPITIWLLSSSLGDLLGTDVPAAQPVGNNSAVNTASVQSQNKAAPVQHNQGGGVNILTADASASIILGEDSSNPFVEISELVVDNANPQQPVMTAKSQVSAGSLPAIPRPNLPGIPTPNPGGFSIPNNVPVTPAAPPAVQGILTSDDGSSMAIMSDGTLLSEGDVYNDGRIAWIGGEGIHFDNGSSILYR